MSSNIVPAQKYFPQIDKGVDPKVSRHLQEIYTALNAHDQAIIAVNTKVKSPATTTATTSGSTSTGSVTQTNITASGVSSFNSQTGPVVYFPNLGVVNDQTAALSYITQTEDNGATIKISSIPVTLNFAVGTPWFTTISNVGSIASTITSTSGTINGLASISLAGGSYVTISFDGTNWIADAPGSTVGGVSQIVAGSNVTISPVGGTGIVTVSASGSGLYSLGGTLSGANIALGTGAGVGATVSIAGLDGNHLVTVGAGIGPVAAANIFTVTFTSSRGHVTYPILMPVFLQYGTFAQIPYVVGGSAIAYSTSAGTTALTAAATYTFNISCP